MVATLSPVTPAVVATKVADVAPAATVTLAGTLAAPSSLDSPMAAPPAGAAELSVTVPEDDVPPPTVVGLRETLKRTGELIVRATVFVTAPALAVIVAVVMFATATVVTVNVAVVAPAPTVTLAGTVAAGLSDERFTANPPACAGALRVTVPVDEAPPAREVGVSVTEERASTVGLMVSAAVFVAPFAVAVTVAVTLFGGADVATLKAAVVAPLTTVTFAGTVA
jgi:hypothetical protein